jgi:hypothetical protein
MKGVCAADRITGTVKSVAPQNPYYNDETLRISDKDFLARVCSSPHDAGVGRGPRRGGTEHSGASSPQPSPPSDGGEGVVAALPRWVYVCPSVLKKISSPFNSRRFVSRFLAGTASAQRKRNWKTQRGWRRHHTSGLRREAKRHAALESTVCPAKSGVAAALCHRSPNLLLPKQRLE